MANRIKQIQFRLKMRAALYQASIEELQIVKEELNKEFLRRRKQHK